MFRAISLARRGFASTPVSPSSLTLPKPHATVFRAPILRSRHPNRPDAFLQQARLSLYSDFVAKVKPSVPAIQVEALDTLLREDPDSAKFHLLDVREPYEWNEERLPYAKYTGRGKLEVQIESLVSDQTDDILLYCSNGTRSMLAAEVLQQIGFKNAKYLSGGVAAWKEANKAVTKNMRVGH